MTVPPKCTKALLGGDEYVFECGQGKIEADRDNHGYMALSCSCQCCVDARDRSDDFTRCPGCDGPIEEVT